MKTLIAIPCMDTVDAGFTQSLMHLEKSSATGANFQVNSLVYDSRNILSLIAIEQGFDRVMWFDSDMMFTPKTMSILTQDMDEHGMDMVTGLYFKRRPPYSPVIFDKLDEPEIFDDKLPVSHVTTYDDYPEDKLFPVKGCGFGCVMTSVPLLKAVWDKFGPAFAPYKWAGEDISFCHRVNQLGYTIWCDSRVSCGHIGTYVYTEKDFKAYKQRGDANGQT